MILHSKKKESGLKKETKLDLVLFEEQTGIESKMVPLVLEMLIVQLRFV